MATQCVHRMRVGTSFDSLIYCDRESTNEPTEDCDGEFCEMGPTCSAHRCSNCKCQRCGKQHTGTCAWPLVTADDGGIRPAGPPDECFYCCEKVGRLHGPECVTVLKRIELRVRAQMPDGTVFTGLWQLDEPYSWDAHLSEFHKNESSWCAGNFVEVERRDVKWDGGGDPWAALTALYNPDEGVCLCNELSFEFVRVVDGTPRLAQPDRLIEGAEQA